jgi:tetratricopeptide (TPR) repeat protein
MDEHDDSVQAIDLLLTELDSIGLACPPHLTLQRLFAVLAEERLVTASSAEALLQLHQETAYAGSGESDQSFTLANQVLDQVKGRAGEDAAAVTRAATRLQQRPAATTDLPEESTEPLTRSDMADQLPAPVRHTDAPEAAVEEAETSLEQESPLTLRLPWRGPRRRTVVMALIGVAWSLAMIAVGYKGHEPIRWGMILLRARIFHYPIPPRDIPAELELARRRAGGNHDSVFFWRNYANSARRFGYSTDAVVAYHHLITRRPDDAELLNSLAWIYCTAEDLHARDPVQALALAERAYAISQAPGVTDTLAEAAFQNGDVERAIILAEDALSRVAGRQKEYYRRQLEKFERAAEGG